MRTKDDVLKMLEDYTHAPEQELKFIYKAVLIEILVDIRDILNNQINVNVRREGNNN